MSIINITLYSLIIVFTLTGVCTTLFLFSMMFLHRSVVKTDSVSYLLAANSYLTLVTVSPFFIEMSLNSIYGQSNPDSWFDGSLCRLKSYALYINGFVYFFSFLLQSIYRFCRIVYPGRPTFHSFRLYVILSLGQWFLGAILLLPSFFLGDIDYLPKDYHCQLPPTSLRKSLLGLSLLFLIPFIATLICYVYTVYYVRTQTTALTSINQNRRIRRDLLILSRLFLLFTFLTAVALPHVLIPIAYAITSYVPTWVVSFEWFLTQFSLSAVAIIQIICAPHLQKICRRTDQVVPVTRFNPTIDK